MPFQLTFNWSSFFVPLGKQRHNENRKTTVREKKIDLPGDCLLSCKCHECDEKGKTQRKKLHIGQLYIKKVTLDWTTKGCRDDLTCTWTAKLSVCHWPFFRWVCDRRELRRCNQMRTKNFGCNLCRNCVGTVTLSMLKIIR